MTNFFTENADLQFHLDHLDLEEVVGLLEDDYRQASEYPHAPCDYEDAVANYRKVLEMVGAIAGDFIAPRAADVDREGVLLKDGKVDMVVGTPGGSTIFTTVFQMIVNNYDFGMSAVESAGAARFHHQLIEPDLVTYTPSIPLPEETISRLSDTGYRVEPHFYEYGDVQTIQRNGERLEAGSDPRFRGESRILEKPAD